MLRVLVAEDEETIRDFIVINLRRHGYDPVEACDGVEAMRIFEEQQGDFQLALLDVMMPNMDGFELCRKLRKESENLGIIMLTARSQEADKVNGLSLGADDYITKPVSMKVLCSRVAAIKNRIKRDEESAPLPISERLVEERHSYISNEGEVRLAVKEFEILQLLLSEPRIFTREEIYSAVWGDGVVVGARTLDVHIRHLRSKIGDNHISTCKGVGFLYKE